MSWDLNPSWLWASARVHPRMVGSHLQGTYTQTINHTHKPIKYLKSSFDITCTIWDVGEPKREWWNFNQAQGALIPQRRVWVEIQTSELWGRFSHLEVNLLPKYNIPPSMHPWPKCTGHQNYEVQKIKKYIFFWVSGELWWKVPIGFFQQSHRKTNIDHQLN